MGLALTTATATAKDSWNSPPRRADTAIQHGTFQSRALKTEVGFNICLPPEYKANATQRFPVIYYLHGYEGNESSYLEYAKYWHQALKQYGPVILVFANGGESSFFTDAPDGSVPGETVVVRELVPNIDQKYRTVATAAGRSLHGYSMGGFGALKFAFKYPDMFGSVVAYGATLSEAPEFKKHLGKVYTKMFGNDSKGFAENDPFSLLEKNAEKIRSSVAVKIIIGTKDEFLPRNRALKQKLEQLKVQVAYDELSGAKHDKDALYEPTALSAFQFSFDHFPKGNAPAGKSVPLDKR